MKHRKKFAEREQAQSQAHSKQESQETTREFSSVEELLRHDAKNIEVPSKVAERLDRSISRIEPAPKPWWKRLFGK